MAPVRPRPPRQQPTRVRPPRDHRDALKRRALDLISKIENKDSYAIFLQPVNLDEIPGYADVISRPMDLSTIRTNVSVGVYRTPDDLRADLDLIWANCIKFNVDDSVYYREAVRLRALAGKYFEEFLRNLARDGLPYGPRRSGASHHPVAAPSGVSRASARQLEKPASAVSLKAAAQRLRYTARVRRKSLESLNSTPVPRTAEPDIGNDPISLFDGGGQKKGQIYSGPYQRLRRFPNSPGAAAFPYVRGSLLQQRLQPFPPAWQALGGRKHVHQQQPNFMSAERDTELQYARHYQDYVTRSAPTARRLLATILDPIAVLEHDAANAKTPNLTSCPSKHPSNQTYGAKEDVVVGLRRDVGVGKDAAETEAEINISPKKRPRHGDLHRTDMRFRTPMDITLAAPSKQLVVQPPSPGAVQDLREILRAHKIDDSFLNSILNDSNLSTCNGNLPSSSASALRRSKTPGGNSSTPLKVQTRRPDSQKQLPLSCGKETTPALPETLGKDLLSNLRIPTSHKNTVAENDGLTHPSDGKGDHEKLESDDEECSDEASDSAWNLSDSSDESSSEEGSFDDGDDDAEEQQRKDAELNELLSMNHLTLLNLMRIKALKDAASGSALKDLNFREQEYAAALREGVALAASKVPPRLLIPKEKAAELAREAARQSIKRRNRKRKHVEMTVEKARAVGAASAPASTVPVGSIKTAIASESTASATSPLTVGSKTVVANAHVQSPVVPPAVRVELKAKQDFVVKKLTPAGVVRPGPTASVVPNKTSK